MITAVTRVVVNQITASLSLGSKPVMTGFCSQRLTGTVITMGIIKKDSPAAAATRGPSQEMLSGRRPREDWERPPRDIGGYSRQAGTPCWKDNMSLTLVTDIYMLDVFLFPYTVVVIIAYLTLQTLTFI